jgi:type IV pilus assembly protein PilA
MKKLHVRKGGFTLIELMIVVAIIGILAAIAIPNFLRFQLKAKSSEGKTNLAAIRTAEQSYYSEFGVYVSSQGESPATIGAGKQVFDPTLATGFDTIGWSPEGNIYFQYGAMTSTGTGFFATAYADIDADTNDQGWAYLKDAGAGESAQTSANGVQCQNTILQNQVVPCDPTYGQSVF